MAEPILYTLMQVLSLQVAQSPTSYLLQQSQSELKKNKQSIEFLANFTASKKEKKEKYTHNKLTPLKMNDTRLHSAVITLSRHLYISSLSIYMLCIKTI